MSDEFAPKDFTISWIRAYSSPVDPATILGLRGDTAACSRYFGPGFAEIQESDYQFWDIQAIRREHVARAVLDGLRVRLRPTDDWWPVHVHLLFHVCGFMVMRFTLKRSEATHGGPARLADWQRLEALPWTGKPLSWEMQLQHRVEKQADVREMMDVVFHDFHERLHGRAPREDVYTREWHFTERYAWHDELVELDETTTAYPVTFGSFFETLWEGDQVPQAAVDNGALLATPIHDESPGDDVHAHIDGLYWFFGENSSVLVAPAVHRQSPSDAEIDALDPIRMQILEFLSLQRAGLRSVQRATQLAISDGTRVRRKEVDRWSRLVAALSDDYVLHDQVAALLEPLRRHLRENDGLRDPDELAEQVHANLDSFDALIEGANSRAGLVLSGLFGLVAASAVDPVVHELAYLISGASGGLSSYADSHTGLMTVLDIGTLGILGAIAVLSYRWFLSRVRTKR